MSTDSAASRAEQHPVPWVTGHDLAQHPTPAELCAIAIALKANLADEVAHPLVATTIAMRELPSIPDQRSASERSFS